MKKILLISANIILIFTIKLNGQTECSELLKYGIYDYFHASENISSFSILKSSLNSLFLKSQKDKEGGKLDGEYKLFSGGASYSRGQVESLYKLMNKLNISESEFNSTIETIQTTINPNVLHAYNECKKLSEESGLKIRASMSPDNVSAITFDISFSKEFTTSIQVRGLETLSTDGKDDCFICDDEKDFGKIAKMGGILKRDEKYSLTCTRKKLVNPITTADGKVIIAKEGLIKIKTNIGNYTLWIPAIEHEKPIPRNIGEVITSMLTEKEFSYLNGNEDWVLADGREVNRESAYCRATGRNYVPDLRGVFLRGKNHSRNDEYQNPDDLPLGTPQKDSFKTHNHHHYVVGWGDGGEPDSRHGKTAGNSPRNHWPETTENSGGNETRPKNVTVNFYIKIN